MVFTTNKPLERWGRVLHDPDLAEAILDRILERGRIVTLEGPSMRTRHLDPVPGLPGQETASGNAFPALLQTVLRACQNIPEKACQNNWNPQNRTQKWGVLLCHRMTPELMATIIAAIAIGVLIVNRSSALQADFRARFGRLGRQIDRLGVTARTEPCDIVLTQGQTLLSRAIRRCTRRVGETRTQVNHVGIVVEAGSPPADAIIVEALHRVQRHPLGKRYRNGRSDVAIYRPTNLTLPERKRIVDAANSYVGRPYGYLKIVLHLLDWLILGAYVFRQLGRSERYPICSWLVAHSFKKVGKHFGVPPGAATPDDIWDFVRESPHYACIRELRPL